MTALARRHPHQPEFLLNRKTHQPATLAIQRREAGLLGNRAQLAIDVVAPGMIGATEARRARTAPLDEARAAMATDVRERPKLSLIVARHQHRRRPEAIGEVVARLFDAATEARNEGILAEQNLALAPRAFLRGVCCWVVARECLGHRRRAAIDRFQRLANQAHLRLMLH